MAKQLQFEEAARQSLLRGVEKLPPASWLRLDLNGNREQQCWWQLEFGPHRDEITLELPDWRDRVLAGLRLLSQWQDSATIGRYDCGCFQRGAHCAFKHQARHP